MGLNLGIVTTNSWNFESGAVKGLPAYPSAYSLLTHGVGNEAQRFGVLLFGVQGDDELTQPPPQTWTGTMVVKIDKSGS